MTVPHPHGKDRPDIRGGITRGGGGNLQFNQYKHRMTSLTKKTCHPVIIHSGPEAFSLFTADWHTIL